MNHYHQCQPMFLPITPIEGGVEIIPLKSIVRITKDIEGETTIQYKLEITKDGVLYSHIASLTCRETVESIMYKLSKSNLI